MNDKYDGVLKELAALLVPHLIAHPDVQAMLSVSSQLVTRESVEEIVQAKLDGLGPIDKDMVREVCEEVVDALDMDDKVNDWFTCNFDITDYQSEVVDMVEDRIDDQVETYLQSHLEGQIESHVRNLTFTVEVS
jgi:cell fate (sporulation/competence/biofilm development) regulator YlbF (YheA/YmcA/DUF963 family)